MLFYSDGYCYSGPPETSPKEGLVLIAQRQDDPTNAAPLILIGDWFAYYDGRWWNHDLYGLLRVLIDRPVQVVRQGVYVREAVFKELFDKARSVTFCQE